MFFFYLLNINVIPGLRAIKSALDDKALIPGAGAFEVAAYRMLMRRKSAVSGRAKLGVEAFANSMLIVPKVLFVSFEAFTYFSSSFPLYYIFLFSFFFFSLWIYFSLLFLCLA